MSEPKSSSSSSMIGSLIDLVKDAFTQVDPQVLTKEEAEEQRRRQEAAEAAQAALERELSGDK